MSTVSLTTWLRDQLPDYAKNTCQLHPTNGGMEATGEINWTALIGEDMLSMLSSGEKFAVALAATAEDRGGVIAALYSSRGLAPTMLSMLSRLPKEARLQYLACLSECVDLVVT